MRYRLARSAAAVVLCLAASAASAARQDDGFIPEAKPQPPAAKTAGGDRVADTIARLVEENAQLRADLAARGKSGDVIDLSELEALREQVQALKAENAQLRKKLAAAPAAGAKPAPGGAARPAVAVMQPPTPARRNYTQIEVAMTRADVDRFIKSRKDLKIVSVSADSGVSRHAEETVVRREGSTAATVVRRGGTTDSADFGPGVVNDSELATNDASRQVVERRTVSGKRETITVAQMEPYKVQRGTSRNSLGRPVPVYGTEYREATRLRVTLIDDVVTAVEGFQR